MIDPPLRTRLPAARHGTLDTKGSEVRTEYEGEFVAKHSYVFAQCPEHGTQPHLGQLDGMCEECKRQGVEYANHIIGGHPLDADIRLERGSGQRISPSFKGLVAFYAWCRENRWAQHGGGVSSMKMKRVLQP